MFSSPASCSRFLAGNVNVHTERGCAPFLHDGHLGQVGRLDRVEGYILVDPLSLDELDPTTRLQPCSLVSEYFGPFWALKAPYE
jgi:hypothetical protein